MPKHRTRSRLSCTGVDFLEVDFPQAIAPRLVLQFSEGISIVLERPEDIAFASELVAAIRNQPDKKNPSYAEATAGRLDVFLQLGSLPRPMPAPQAALPVRVAWKRGGKRRIALAANCQRIGEGEEPACHRPGGAFPHRTG